MTWPAEKQHGIASYHKGCRCESCKRANREARRRYRRAARSRDPLSRHRCMICADAFRTALGLRVHEVQIHDIY